MHGLYRVDQHAGNVAPRFENPQGRLVHVFQRIGLACRQRIADAGLHIAPPAVISAAEAHEAAAPRVIAREAHRLHHRFGARHVKGHLLHARYLQEPAHVVGGHRMVEAEHGPQVANALAAAGDALLVEVVAEYVDAVGSGQVVEPVAVEIGQRDAGGGLDEGSRLEVVAHEAAELERHAVAGGELQIGNAVHDRVGRFDGSLAAPGEARRKAQESLAPRRRNLLGRRVDTEKAVLAVFVERHQCGEAPSHARVPRQRAVLRPRKLQPQLRLAQQRRQCAGDQQIAKYRFDHANPRRALYCRRMTLR